ncbi:MAG: hypothetical protein KF888_10790 [Nitrosomonas sp.]|nr:hypothetical protein [Nitrosomonas sp.]
MQTVSDKFQSIEQITLAAIPTEQAAFTLITRPQTRSESGQFGKMDEENQTVADQWPISSLAGQGNQKYWVLSANKKGAPDHERSFIETALLCKQR